MADNESLASSSFGKQFRLISLKLPALNDQNIKSQVQETHGHNYALVLRHPLLDSISHILKPATNFLDSILLNSKESKNGDELETTNILELNSTLSELDALTSDRCFSTRALLEREDCNRLIGLEYSMLVKFSTISELKKLARDDRFMFPTLLMDKTANKIVQKFGKNNDIEIESTESTNMSEHEMLLGGHNYFMFLKNVVQTSDEINLHVASMELLQFLSYLSWDAKTINTMGCFIFKFLEFLGFLLHGPKQPITELASSMAALNDNPVSLESTPLEKFIVPLDQLNNLIKITLEVIEYISTFTLLSDTEYNKEDLLSSCAYWAISSLIACYIQTTLLMNNGEMGLELSHLISNLSYIVNNLKHHYTICKPQIEEMEAHLQYIEFFESTLKSSYTPTEMSEQLESYRNGCLPCSTMSMVLQRIAFHVFGIKEPLSTIPIEMPELMKSFMYSKDGHQSLVDGSTMSKVDLEVLKEKAVLLFISDLDIPTEEIDYLLEIYKQIRKEEYYKIVWVPFVLEWTEELRQKFEHLKSTMPWYIVCCDSPITGIWYIKGRPSFFRGRPSFVIIDLRFGNQYLNPDPDSSNYLIIREAKHFPFKRLGIGSIVPLAGLPTLNLLYPKPHEEDVNQEKPSSGFQGLVAMSKSRGSSNLKQSNVSQAHSTSKTSASSISGKAKQR